MLGSEALHLGGCAPEALQWLRFLIIMLHASILIVNYGGILCGPTWDAKLSYLELQAVSQNENLTQYYLMCNLGFLSPNKTKQIINL